MTTPVWPSALVDSLRRGDCVVFVGAGFTKSSGSSGSATPVSWNELLLRLLDSVFPRSANGRRQKRGSEISSQIRSGDLLWAAQALEIAYTETGRLNDFRQSIAEIVDGPGSDKFKPGEAHQALVSLDPRTIVTTNYDKVLERLFSDGYTYLTYKSDNIAASIRQGRPIVLKLHGTVDDPAGMILTRLDFSHLRRSGNQALAVLEALALTRTVLFLGYSLHDPDLHLILENQFGASGATVGHYLLAHSRAVSDEQRNVFSSAFGVEVLKYSGDPSRGFIEALERLTADVDEQRAKQMTG